jgi:hypothetical protein
MVRMFRALSDPTRVEIVQLVSKSPRNVTELTSLVGVSQPKVSRHLKILRDAGLLNDVRRGKWVWYEMIRHAGGEPGGTIAVAMSMFFHGGVMAGPGVMVGPGAMAEPVASESSRTAFPPALTHTRGPQPHARRRKRAGTPAERPAQRPAERATPKPSEKPASAQKPVPKRAPTRTKEPTARPTPKPAPKPAPKDAPQWRPATPRTRAKDLEDFLL